MEQFAGLPETVRIKAAELLAGRAQVPPLRDAATVALLRDGVSGLEVFMQRRVTGMAFAGGRYVFPGGAVEVQDTDESLPWVSGPAEAPFAYGDDIVLAVARSDPPEVVHRWLVAAGVRETLEEAGVLLAQPLGSAPTADEIEAARNRLLAGDPLKQVLNDLGVALRADLLVAFEHWITPAVEPRRYDTRFFLAALPPGQEARSASGESDLAQWTRPAEILARAQAGEVLMLPPTVAALTALAAADSVAAAVAGGHREGLRPVLPHPYRDGDGIGWRLIDGYTGEPL